MLLTSKRLARRSFLNRSGAVLGGMLIGLPSVAASPTSAAAESLDKVVEEFYAAYEALDAEKLLSFLADDCFFEDPTFHLKAQGKPAIRKMFEAQLPGISDVKIQFENRFGCSNWYVTQNQLSGKVKVGKEPDREVKSFSVKGVTIFHFAAGKIDRWNDYYDFATFLKQTGTRSNI